MPFSPEPESQISSYRIFNRGDRFAQGWYWALPSRRLKPGQVKPVTLQGRNLAIYRRPDGQLGAVDAYCPHMGAHLAEGRVEADGLRCFFHNWKFDALGRCIESPALGKPVPVGIQTWPVAERYGLIWVWTGTATAPPLPHIPHLTAPGLEFTAVKADSWVTNRFVKNCHPNVVMINAIDAHHFNTVHQLPLDIIFEQRVLNSSAVQFNNTTRGGDESWLIRLIRPFYRHAVTYSLCYWYGSTGSVTVGPDFLHFHILFALRLLPNGQTEGQTVLVTSERTAAWLLNPVILWLTQQVGNYFAKGDTQIFQTIRFDLKTPTKADRSILQFIDHLEQQTALAYGSWDRVEVENHLEPQNPEPERPEFQRLESYPMP
jgi:phenylpropionate dioxygenase-like ring-hydroxylating dioxygenase large terminal subunit